MSATSKSNFIIGSLFVAFAVLMIFVWIPLDTASGIIEKVRGRYNIGDALAPTISALFLLIGGLLLAIFERSAEEQFTFGRDEFLFMLQTMLVISLGLLVMRYTGPLLVDMTNVFRAEQQEYRLLRATAGWKHVGFVFGGIIAVTGLISVIERKVTRRAIVTGILVVVVLIVIFDIPFEDLQLPPNGDV